MLDGLDRCMCTLTSIHDSSAQCSVSIAFSPTQRLADGVIGTFRCVHICSTVTGVIRDGMYVNPLGPCMAVSVTLTASSSVMKCLTIVGSLIVTSTPDAIKSTMDPEDPYTLPNRTTVEFVLFWASMSLNNFVHPIYVVGYTDLSVDVCVIRTHGIESVHRMMFWMMLTLFRNIFC